MHILFYISIDVLRLQTFNRSCSEDVLSILINLQQTGFIHDMSWMLSCKVILFELDLVFILVTFEVLKQDELKIFLEPLTTQQIRDSSRLDVAHHAVFLLQK